MSAPAKVAVGDVVVPRLMPAFRMRVLDVRPCETDWNRSEPHSALQIVDPDGTEDWLCAYDVRVVAS